MSDTPTIGAAIIGTGKVALAHATALAADPRSRFEAVCNPDPLLAGPFAQRYGVRAFTNARELVQDPAVEAVCICTPHPSHAELALLAARHGVHVLVEKPMALSVEDCDRIIQAADRAGVKLGVISQRRLYEPVQRVKRAIDEGRIGRPILGSATVLSWRGPEYDALDDWRGTWEGEDGVRQGGPQDGRAGPGHLPVRLPGSACSLPALARLGQSWPTVVAAQAASTFAAESAPSRSCH